MTPRQRYQRDLNESLFYKDSFQAKAVEALQKLYEGLDEAGNRPSGLLARLLGRPLARPGVYLVGGVGRGKTYLMDLFYECLEMDAKYRVHFHRFMLDIHDQLKCLPKSPDPLPIISKRLSEKIRVLCLDEFHVTDVADAMLLTGLLKPLFKDGVVLVATSNTPIRDLYLNGLQRERFMEAISLLTDHMVEVDLGGGRDYRLEHLEKGETYILTRDENNLSVLDRKFREMAAATVEYDKPLPVNNREIQTVAMVEDLVWFEFSELCHTPRAASDYLEIARLFHTVFITHIPVLQPADDSAAKRFMHLVDALYDHRVKLVTTARVRPEKLYNGKLLIGMFDRTVSRLIEMGSHDYLSEQHRS